MTVRDRMMIAHSLPDPFFGPAQQLHGATYVVEATLLADDLDSHGVVADIGALAGGLREVLAGLDYRNLDDVPDLAGVVTTTEVLARFVADRLVERVSGGALGAETGHLRTVEVLLRESDVAWASCRRDLPEPA
ncbi:MAG: 6-carboxytetrahydropterin synthase [Nocardioidaceae bacterium]|nr:6-carboxytetrahydropterin synthase [Nocardioidaceae bacterium]